VQELRISEVLRAVILLRSCCFGVFDRASGDLPAASVQVPIEPRYGSKDAIALVGWIYEVVAFVFVDDELGFDAEGF